MKKPYEKPMLYVEDFSLSEHIATGCEVVNVSGPKNSTTPMSCSLDLGFGPNMRVFTHGNVLCDLQFEPDGSDGFDCYHGPQADHSVFSS